jgi:hypothetical protein
MSTDLIAAKTPGLVLQSRGGRSLFLFTVLVTAALVLWTHAWAHGSSTYGLTPIFFFLFVVGDYAALKCALAIGLAAAVVPNRFRTSALLQWLGWHPGWAAAGSVVMLSCGAWMVYLHSPLSMDEYAPFFQSQVFAAGHLAGQFPPQLLDWLIPRAFQNYFLNVRPGTGLVTSAYWPSFALLLTPFTWLGVPWMANPVISGLTILSVHRLALRIFVDRGAAGLAVLLTAASPVFFADGISYYSMSAHLLANTLFALLLVAPTPRRAFLAGLIGSVALTLHNPVPHILFALPWIAASLWRRDGLRTSAWLFAGYLPLCLVLGLGWFVLTSPAGGGIAHNSPFAWPSQSVFLARTVGIAKVWAWAVPGLPILAAVGAWKRRGDNPCLLLALSALLTLVVYVFVPFDQGHGWGYRYFHSAWIALPILATAAVSRTPSDAHGAGAGKAGIFEDGAARSFIVACALLSLTVGIGFRAVQIREFIVEHQSQMPAYPGTERRVIILDTRATFYGRDLVQNDPWLRDAATIMITHGPDADAAMMRANYPQLHRVYADRFGSVWSAVKP